MTSDAHNLVQAAGSAAAMRSSDGPSARSAVGLWLDALNAHRVAVEPSGELSADEGDASVGPAIPPAVLLPRFRDEPLAFDFTWPPHPRGSGDAWPPEARVEPPDLPGRLPLAYAWPMLREGARWRWAGRSGRSATLGAEEAIARLIVAAAPSEPDRPVGVAVSESLDKPARQRLGEALQRAGMPAALIDAGEAAVRAAESLGQGPALPPRHAGEPAPEPAHVLHLHLGFDQWHADLLDVTPSAMSETRVVDRTPIVEPVPGIGLGLLHTIAERAIAMSYKRAAPAPLWQLLWTTPWASEVLASLAGRIQDVAGQRFGLSPHVCRQQFLRQHARLPVQQAINAFTSSVVPYPAMLGQRPDPSPLQDQLQSGYRKLGASGKAKPDHALVTGDLAMLRDERGVATLAEQYLHQLHPGLRSASLQGRDLPDDVLARGAALAMRDRG